MALAVGVWVVSLVVLPSLHTFRAKNVVQVRASVRFRVHPGVDSLEHDAVGFVVHVSHSGVVEYSHAIVQHLFNGDVHVLPRVEDTGNDISQDGRGNLARRLIKHVREMVLGQQGVGGVRARGICPRPILMFSRGIHNTGRPSLQLLRSCVNNWADERS
jgi:hypothetical protein